MYQHTNLVSGISSALRNNCVLVLGQLQKKLTKNKQRYKIIIKGKTSHDGKQGWNNIYTLAASACFLIFFFIIFLSFFVILAEFKRAESRALSTASSYILSKTAVLSFFTMPPTKRNMRGEK
jgi:hypothetical protein